MLSKMLKSATTGPKLFTTCMQHLNLTCRNTCLPVCRMRNSTAQGICNTAACPTDSRAVSSGNTASYRLQSSGPAGMDIHCAHSLAAELSSSCSTYSMCCTSNAQGMCSKNTDGQGMCCRSSAQGMCCTRNAQGVCFKSNAQGMCSRSNAQEVSVSYIQNICIIGESLPQLAAEQQHDGAH